MRENFEDINEFQEVLKETGWDLKEFWSKIEEKK